PGLRPRHPRRGHLRDRLLLPGRPAGPGADPGPDQRGPRAGGPRPGDRGVREGRPRPRRPQILVVSLAPRLALRRLRGLRTALTELRRARRDRRHRRPDLRGTLGAGTASLLQPLHFLGELLDPLRQAAHLLFETAGPAL